MTDPFVDPELVFLHDQVTASSANQIDSLVTLTRAALTEHDYTELEAAIMLNRILSSMTDLARQADPGITAKMVSDSYKHRFIDILIRLAKENPSA